MKTVALFLVLSLARMYSWAQSPTGTTNSHEAANKATYLVLYRPGPAWLTGKSVMEQALKQHGKLARLATAMLKMAERRQLLLHA